MQIKHPEGGYPFTNLFRRSALRKKFLTDKRIGEGGKENPEAATYLKPEDFIWKTMFLHFMVAKIIIQIETARKPMQCRLESAQSALQGICCCKQLCQAAAECKAQPSHQCPAVPVIPWNWQGDWQESPPIHAAEACKSY